MRLISRSSCSTPSSFGGTKYIVRVPSASCIDGISWILQLSSGGTITHGTERKRGLLSEGMRSLCVYAKYRKNNPACILSPSSVVLLLETGYILHLCIMTGGSSRPLAIHSNDEEIEEIPTPLLNFDILLNESIENVLRCLSDTPRVEKWTQGVNLEEISVLYDVQGSWERFCKHVLPHFVCFW